MERRQALEELGLTGQPTWEDIRVAFRDRIRVTHPDVAGEGDGATVAAARLNEAYATLRATWHQADDGRPAGLDGSVTPTPPVPVDEEPAVTLVVPPGDAFIALLEAAHRLGDVSYVDPDSGLIQLLVTDGDGRISQLVADIDTVDGDTVVAFTLETLDGGPAPPIRSVVAAFAACL